MGNGTSQSIVLGPPRFQEAHHYQRGVPRYVHPQNMVLPKPILGQRLRCTDNGSILQSAGTIRGQRRDDAGKEDILDSEVLGVLKRRSEMIEKENDCCHHLNLRNHRMFHSDPDIARTRTNAYANQEIADGYGQRRGCGGGVAVRASKLKYKKKARAPDPPPSAGSLDRSPQGGSYQKNQRGSPCKCINKTKAPQPPVAAMSPPPPPPPLPVTTRTNVELSSRRTTSQLSPSVTRGVECSESRNSSYEKNVHPLDRWRICRSMGDVRIDEENDGPLSETRPTVFDSRKIDVQDKKPSYLPQRNDPFQKEIQAVTKKIAETKFTSPKERARSQSPEMKKDQVENHPKQYYFSDATAFKANGHQKSDSSDLKDAPTQNKDVRAKKSDVRTSIDEIVPSLQRFSPARRKLKSPNRNSTPTPIQKAEKEWEHLSKSIHNRQDDESDIDIRLRPVLPRKTPEMPKFSPSEAWQALGSDGLGSSNQSTSDESIRYGRTPLRAEDRSRRVPDTSHGFKQRSFSDSQWTPRQDLLDDSDVSSEDSEDAVAPRMRSSSSEFPTRFALPTVMFSNMRPIGYELCSNKVPAFFDDHYKKTKQTKKKLMKNVDPVDELNSVSNFKKLLGKKNRYLSEEDVAVSDSNWTFGQQQGLQKRGKQYSSDLMLSDRKKSDIMMKNSLGDFLGDILVANANNMRHQMKSSDSGNSNFSFYSTEGQVMYNMPEDVNVNRDHSSPSKGRVYDIRRKFDANLDRPRPQHSSKTSKRKLMEMDMERKRDLELVRMLEDEVRKRRNKEKITIRQQLQRMKNLNSEDEEEFDDEAYFTEPKSREETQSPFFAPGPSHYNNGYPAVSPADIGFSYSHLHPEIISQRRFNAANSSHLSHWQSSPALLEDCFLKGTRPTNKGRIVSSPIVMSSPDPEMWQRPNKSVNSWLLRQQNHLGNGSGLRNLQEEPALNPIERSSSEESRPLVNGRRGEDEADSPVVEASSNRKEKRKTNIYKQLMDIVRREERNLKESQGGDFNQNSRESSYSQRESSHSTVSESGSTSSYSYSDSSGSKNHAKNGISANREFHASTSMSFPVERRDVKEPKEITPNQPTFQVNFVQPYSPHKSYRPVPFDIAPPAAVNG